VLSPTSRTPHSARSDAFSPFATVQLDGAAAAADSLPESWEGICDWVLGQRVDLWEAAFEPVFLQASVNTSAWSTHFPHNKSHTF